MQLNQRDLFEGVQVNTRSSLNKGVGKRDEHATKRVQISNQLYHFIKSTNKSTRLFQYKSSAHDEHNYLLIVDPATTSEWNLICY